MPGKKILHLSMTKSIGGIASFQKNLFDHIDRDSYTFEFVTTYRDAALISYFEEHGVKVHRLPPQKRVIKYCRALYRLLKQENYDAVHIHKNSCANPMAFVVCAKAGVLKIIAHSHNTASVGGRLADLFHYVFRPLVRRLSHVRLACSEQAADWLYGKKHTKDYPAEIIKNGIEIARFTYNIEIRDETRREFGWEDRIVFGHVGNYIPQKNHSFMIDVLAETLKSDPRVVLALIGRGDAMKDVKAYAEQKGVSDSVFFLGSRKDVERFYQAMDLFLFPSIHEGLPIAGVEAQAADLPCLFSDAITDEILLTDRAVVMPLSSDAASWAERALALAAAGAERKDVSDILNAAGYDAVNTAKRMEKVYAYEAR